MKQVIIDPRLKYNYASWYLLGIEKILRGESIIYDVNSFKEIKYENTADYNSGFAFIIRDKSQEKKIFIDTEDVAKIFLDRYEWCDVYGMVNPTKEQLEKYSKLLAIGPEFSVTLRSRLVTFLLCIKLFFKGFKLTSISFKEYLRDYLYTNIRRRPIEKYEHKIEIRSNYIFHASTLWYNQFAATDTNMYRGEFLKACKKADLEIEGGLFYVKSNSVLKEMPDYPKYKEEYKDFIYENRLSMDEYIKKTKESVLVFNTPSVCECHGWKLAEYLCMGKAIISTPLTREMPAALEHGKHVHFVNSIDEIYDAVVKINSDEHYRKQLEEGAREYYEKWIAPEIVIQRLLKKVGEQL
ncbi:glycosyltransferase [Prevotella aurantiaca]|uniref:glycosyltransferase n=1 Tax=Prevotella aurantiaca TaxID=596085 RepID=UPI00288ACB34|nr:glycosyltransferase [Prevotella aurantiaca]